jgi:hypothetical protein
MQSFYLVLTSYRIQVKKCPGKQKKLAHGNTITGVIHHNCLIVDGELIATGSYDYTWSATNLNAEDLYITLNINAVRTWKSQYQSLWEGTW